MNLKDLLVITKKRILINLIILRVLLSLFNVFVSILIQLGINNIMGNETIISLINISCMMIGGSFLFILMYYGYNFLLLEWITEINLCIVERVIEKVLVTSTIDSSLLSEGKLLNIVSDDIEAISNFLKYGLLPLVDTLITLLAGLVYVFYGHYVIGSIFTLSGIMVLLINRNNATNLEIESVEYTQKKDGYLTGLEKIYHTIPIMRTFIRSEWITNRFNIDFEKKSKSYQRYYKTYGKMYATSEGSIGILEIVVLVIGLLMVINGQILFGTLIGVWNAGLGSVLYPLGALPDYFSYYNQYKVSLLRIKKYYGLDTNSISNHKTQKVQFSQETKIKVENINFSYGTHKIFKDFSTIIRGKGITYISGESGKGKSTLFQLIFKELKVNSGQILYEGPGEYIRFSFVPQKNIFFTTNIMKNLKLFNEKITDEKVINICKSINILDDINQLPNQFETEFKGELLSSGQQRCLSIARALLIESDYVFLDEPFSDLDLNKQKLIIDVLEKESKKRGIVIISHTTDFINYANYQIKVGE